MHDTAPASLTALMAGAFVVGGDGLLGRELIKLSRERGLGVLATSRRAEPGGFLTLDLAHPPANLAREPRLASVARDGGAAFLLAGRTGFAACADDPEGSRRVNVTGTLNVARQAVEAGLFVVFASSNAVFPDGLEGPGEAESTAPSSEYGRQKAEAEAGILALGGAVVRISKVVACSGLIGGWLNSVSMRQPIEAASDLVLAPVSTRHAAEALLRVADLRRSGIYHLSGAASLSYFSFAQRLAHGLGVAIELVRSVHVRPKGERSVTNSGRLGMGPVSASAGLVAQAIDATIKDLLDEFRGAA